MPLVIKERFLQGVPCAHRTIYTASLNTPGENRVVSQSAWETGIAEGVRAGLFGLGELVGQEPVCHYFKEPASVALSGDEVIIRAELCQAQKDLVIIPGDETTTRVTDDSGEFPITRKATEGSTISGSVRTRLRLRLIVPKGKVANLMGVMNLLQSRFNRMEVTLDVEQGQLSEQEYEDKIKEAFRQMGADVREE